MSASENTNSNESSKDTTSEAQTQPTQNSLSLKDKVEVYTKTIGLFVTIGALIVTYCTYDAAQKWKKAEFTSLKVQDFRSNQAVRTVKSLLDYNEIKVSLNGKDTLRIKDKQLYETLRHHSEDGFFSDNEVLLRATFDEYFDQLGLFNRYAKAGLIKYDEMKPYLIYEIKIMCDTTNDRKHNDLREPRTTLFPPRSD
ncbi:MAG: hypothetical protein IT272_13710 [Chitinophagales bacterium]|nr:hypothetical protein [Chitinophagales bacterium]